MKKLDLSLAALISLTVFLICGAAPGFAAQRYPAGVEGGKCGTVPPPGFHARFYYVNASYDQLKNNDGNDIPIGFDLDIAGYVPRLIYITDKKLFGADWGMNVTLPITDIHMQQTARGFDESSSGIGDIQFGPMLLGWHKPRYDVGFGLALIVPIGKYDKDRPLNHGLGYYSTQLTLGGTYHFDDQKSLSASVLTRTIYNFENSDTNQQKGMEFAAEWGVTKNFRIGKMIVRPGIVGFGHWDISDHDGYANDDLRYQKYGIGAEVNLMWLPPTKLQLNLRALTEFGAENAPQGNQIVMTLTKSF